MKKNVLIFGLTAGAINAIWLILFMGVFAPKEHMDFENGMLIGYTEMFLSLSLIVVAIKNYRDKYNGGMVSFGKAFQIGLYISLIASTFYVLAWEIDYHYFVPDFGEKYTAHMIKEMKDSGMPQAELDVKAAEITKSFEDYKSPLVRIPFTYAEILPVGLLITLISSLILKRNKPKTPQTVIA
jgi:hypothetical protein